MYDDFQDIHYVVLAQLICQRKISNVIYVQIETSILQKLEYDLFVPYEDFFHFIHDYSKEISSKVAIDVLKVAKLYF